MKKNTLDTKQDICSIDKFSDFVSTEIYKKQEELFNIISINQQKEIAFEEGLLKKLNIYPTDDLDIKYAFDIKYFDVTTNNLIFDFGFTEKIKKNTPLNMVTYYRPETLSEYIEHNIVCVGTNKHFEDNIFSKLIEKKYYLVSLENDGNFENGVFLENSVTYPLLGHHKIKKPKQREYTFFTKDVYDNISPGLKDLIIDGIEDGSFKILFMLDVSTKK